MKRFMVVGLGNFGAAVAEALQKSGHEVTALDVDPQLVDRIAPYVAQAAVGDGTHRAVLERIGAKDVDAGVVATGDDITASVLTTLALRDCGVTEIYVKVISHEHARVIDKLGATETIFPERDTALLLAKRLSDSWLINYVELGPGFSAQELAVPQVWVGKSLRELELPRNFRISVIAVHDFLTGKITAIPNPDAVLKDSDTLLVAGNDEDLLRLEPLKRA